MEWNESQKRVLEKLDDSVLVAASAGSGKTAVMIERIMRLILTREVSIERMVMLAFNNEIAAEIREKLRNALERAAVAAGDNSAAIIGQIDALPLAQISTFHSFCKNLICEYFEYTELGASFTILEQSAADALLNRALNTVFDGYNASADSVFLRLRLFFGGRGDGALREVVTNMYRFMCVQKDREEWLSNAASSYTDFENSPAVVDALEVCKSQAILIFDELEFAKNKLKSALLNGSSSKTLDGAVNFFTEACTSVKALKDACSARDLCAVPQITSTYMERNLLGFAEKNSSQYDIADAIRANELKETVRKLMHGLEVFTNHSYEKHLDNCARVKAFVEKLSEITDAVSREYSSLKRADNKADYNDLELGAVQVLKNDDISEEIRARYDYVSVDEYQDVNHVQEYVIRRVARWNNLFTVGDSKQSIYGFRLTEPEIMLERERVYKDRQVGEVEHFNLNYRSDHGILRFVNDVFSYCMTEDFGGVNYARDAMFRVDDDGTDKDGCPVSVNVFLEPCAEKRDVLLPEDGVYSPIEHIGLRAIGSNSENAEAAFIVSKIEELIGKHDLTYGDIAILMERRGTRARVIVKAIVETGIPVDIGGLDVSASSGVVKDILNLLTVVDDIRNDIALAAVMLGPFGGFGHDELLRIRLRRPDERLFSEAVIFDEDVKVCDFVNKVIRWRAMSGYLTVTELVSAISDEVGYKEHRDFIAGLSGTTYTVSLSEYMYSIKNSKPKDTPSTPNVNDGGRVSVMTVHASKGLEFPAVFLIDASSRFRTDTGRVLFDKDAGVAMRSYDEDGRSALDTPAYAFVKRKEVKKTKEERMRLLYVALTRAKRHLFVTGARQLNKSSASFFPMIQDERQDMVCNATNFCDWLYAAFNADKYITEIGVDEIELRMLKKESRHAASVVGATPKETFVYPFQASVQTAFKNTVTSINGEEGRFNFYTPRGAGGAESAARGSAYHKVMEYIDYSAVTVDGVISELATFTRDGIMTQDEVEEVEPKIIADCLASPFMRTLKRRVVQREKSFVLYAPANEVTAHHDVTDKILVQGTIDALVLPEKDEPAMIIDFKRTGRNPAHVRETYRRQIEIYKYAVKRILNLQDVQAFIYVLGTGEVVEFL